MYAQLGDIVFDGQFSPTSSECEQATSLAEHAVVEGKPRLQVTGDALERRREVLRLHRSFCDVGDVLRRLREAREAHEPMALLTGTGTVLGRFLIAEMRTRSTVSDADGELVAAEVDLALVEWLVVDPVEFARTRAVGARRAAPAVRRRPPGTRTVTTANADGFTSTKIARR